MADTVTLGAAEYVRTATGMVRLDNRVFSKNLAPVALNNDDFRFTLLRPGTVTLINNLVQSVTWVDDVGDSKEPGTPVLTGSMVVSHIPKDDDPHAVRVRSGDVVRCQCRWFGSWREVWRMRVITPDIDYGVASATLDLADDLQLLMLTKDDLSKVFKKTRTGSHQRGWHAHEVAAWCARHFKFRIDVAVRGRAWIKNLNLGANDSAYKAIKRAYQQEAHAHGKVFQVSWRNGKLRIVHVTGKSVPYLFYLQQTALTVTSERRADFCTALTLTATTKKGKTTRKKAGLKVTVSSKAAIKRFGYIHANATTSTADTVTELRAEAKRRLARRMYQRRSVSFEHPGVPFFRAGEAMRVIVLDQGMGMNARSICFARTVEHTLSTGTYTMAVQASFDPLLSRADTISVDAAKRQEKRS